MAGLGKSHAPTLICAPIASIIARPHLHHSPPIIRDIHAGCFFSLRAPVRHGQDCCISAVHAGAICRLERRIMPKRCCYAPHAPFLASLARLFPTGIQLLLSQHHSALL